MDEVILIGDTLSRSQREKKIVGTMIQMYCRGCHGSPVSLCSECRELLEYASRRVEKCPFGERKPTCAKCTVHCYDHTHRDRIRAVMRYSGPRMTYRHPLMAGRHFIDGRNQPKSRNAGARNER